MIGKLIRRYFLLNKRLFKKYSFLLILCLVPAMVGAMNIMSQEESGIVSIALCLKNPDDELAAGIIDEFMEKDSVFRYIFCDEEEEARRLVTNYEVDTAWIFSESFKKDLENAAADKRCEPVVTVVEREDNVPLRFSRQILVSKIYSDFSYLVYENFVRDDMDLGDVSDAELETSYEKMFVEGSLFQLEYPDGEREETVDNNYLLTPIRGILAIWIVLCGFAASMYFMQDEQNGVFSRVALKNRLWTSLGMHAVILSDGVVVMLIALKLSGVFTSWAKELLVILLFAGCTLVFCNLVRLLCHTPERLGVCIPILLIGMLVMCPVFINSRSFGVLPYLLPPYYYLKSIHSTYYLYGMMVYIGAMFFLCVLISEWKNRNKG